MGVGPWLDFYVFPNSQRDFVIFECCSSWTSRFFAVYEKVGKLGFMNIKSKFVKSIIDFYKANIVLPNFSWFTRGEKLGFAKPP